MKKLLSLTLMATAMVALSGCHTTQTHKNATFSGLPAEIQTTSLGDTEGFTSEKVERIKARREQQGTQQTIYFAFDNSIVDPKYAVLVKQDAVYLKEHPKSRLRLEGNTDERGSREYNIGLGWRRANRVADSFRLLGVNKDQIVTVSYGKEKPVSLGHTDKDYALNRRVDMVFEQY
ncbi:MAG: OmpA family protein [Gammaproteobacteria bacterium]